MKKIINYENDIKFKNKIASINSISIEDTYKLVDNKILINFIISGDYKINELSVNNELFKYELPLEYEFEDYVDKSTVHAEIENFEYNTLDDNLNIIVDYKLEYEKKEEIIMIPSEEEINKNIIEEEISRDSEVDVLKLEPIKEEKESEKKEKFFEIDEANEEEETTILKVHVYKLGETIESIASLYNVDVDLIKGYNDITNLENKDKIIVPINNE